VLIGLLTGSLFYGLGHQPQDARTFFGACFMVGPSRRTMARPASACTQPQPLQRPHPPTHPRPPPWPNHQLPPPPTAATCPPCPPQLVLFMMFGAFPQVSIVQEQKRAWYKHREARMFPAYAQVRGSDSGG
jgi:hypothetical protein